MSKRHVVALVTVMLMLVVVVVATIAWITSGDSQPGVPPECSTQGDVLNRSDGTGLFFDC